MKKIEIEWNEMGDEEWDYFVTQAALMNIVDLTHELTGDSKTKCRQLIQGGAFKLNDVKLDDIDIWIDIRTGRFYKGINGAKIEKKKAITK
jgi:hypothetical protein